MSLVSVIVTYVLLVLWWNISRPLYVKTLYCLQKAMRELLCAMLFLVEGTTLLPTARPINGLQRNIVQDISIYFGIFYFEQHQKVRLFLLSVSFRQAHTLFMCLSLIINIAIY